MHDTTVVEQHEVTLLPTMREDIFWRVDFALEFMADAPNLLYVIDDRLFPRPRIRCREGVDTAAQNLQVWLAISVILPDHLTALANSQYSG
jgi:hypothetical protein